MVVRAALTPPELVAVRGLLWTQLGREHGLWRGEPASWADFDGRRSSSPTRPGVLGPATGYSDGVMHSTAQSDALWCGKTKVRLQHCSGICCCRTRLPVYNDFMHLH